MFKTTISGRTLYAAMRATMNEEIGVCRLVRFEHSAHTLTIDGISNTRLHRVEVPAPDGYGEITLKPCDLKRAVKTSAKRVTIDWDGASPAARIESDGKTDEAPVYEGRVPDVPDLLEMGSRAGDDARACGVNPAYLMDACRACEAVGGTMRLEVTGETSPIHVRAVNGKRGTFRGIIMPVRLDY